MSPPSQHMHHSDEVVRVASSPRAAATSAIAASWSRSLNRHGLDPSNGLEVSRLSQAELDLHRDAMELMFRVSQSAMDQLHAVIGVSGFSIYLCDPEGVIVDHRIRDADSDTFGKAGLVAGADWSEGSQGTNGIGTCIAEARPVAIHRNQHFRSCNTKMSCMGAPVFDEKGEIAAVLDVSSCREDADKTMLNLIAQNIAATARQIESDHFDQVFIKERIIRGKGDGAKGPVLFAVDRNDLIVGATRTARKIYKLDGDLRSRPLPASDVLGDSEERGVGFESAEKRELRRAVARANGNMSDAARILGVSRATLYRRLSKHGLDGDN